MMSGRGRQPSIQHQPQTNQGLIAVEGLEDALLRYLDVTRDSRYGDVVLVSRDDLIYPEAVCKQFVNAHLASKSHTFIHEVVWVIGVCVAVRVPFIQASCKVEAFADPRQLESETMPQSSAQSVSFWVGDAYDDFDEESWCDR
jgi:hypothetical protein